jgi:hypothetical protein
LQTSFPTEWPRLCCIGGYDINRFDASMQKENKKEQLKMINNIDLLSGGYTSVL